MLRAGVVAMALTVTSAGAGFALDGCDPAKGEQIFKQCMTCHRIGPDAKNAVGPVLTGVVGRATGTYPGFAYSDLNKHAGEAGLVWTEDNGLG